MAEDDDLDYDPSLDDEGDEEAGEGEEEGGPSGEPSGGRKEKEKDRRTPGEKVKDTAKDIKKKAEQLKRAARRAKKLAKEVPQRIRQAQRAAKATADAIRIAAQTIKAAGEAAVRLAGELAKLLPKLIPLLFNPITWVVVLAIVIIVAFAAIFMGSANYINSLAGGSKFLAADYSNPAHRQIVANLEQKMSGCAPKLVLYHHEPNSGVSDISWQLDPKTGQYYSPLDIRLLKALDYLTDRHDRIRVDLLKTGAPDVIRDNFLKKIARYSPTGMVQQEIKETFSAFKTGQAASIVEIDRSRIPELQEADTVCGDKVPAPIAVGWQKTVAEKTIRPIWEELTFSAGYLDDVLDTWFVGVASRNDRAAILKVAESHLASLASPGAYDAYGESFQKIPRIAELIDRALQYGARQSNGKQALDERTLQYLRAAQGEFAGPASRIGDKPESLNAEAITDLIIYLGQPDTASQLRQGIRFVYKATQVANMVNWNKSQNDGDLAWLKAYESRDKIRQVIKELMEMPREASLSGQPTVLFDESLMAKQIVTWSPEDDLDNGLENLDVFPYGAVTVDVGGVGMKTLSVDPRTGTAIGDGKVTVADTHFSHAPIDNGVFSKSGTNFVYGKAAQMLTDSLMFASFPLGGGAGVLLAETAVNKLHDLFVGGCLAGATETCQKVSYRDFLFVAF
jgi:hypothetical protein